MGIVSPKCYSYQGMSSNASAGGNGLARKRGKRGDSRKRQRAQQRAQYDELDKYPVMPPHAFAKSSAR